ncbi:MAG: glycoside hydrolase family 3 C-terminal domain-containing protein [Lachnospiraceae bacterium]|nr:glycoside hydrolase family 3 C-terminal domain-containing protein [Lachnospiraceae bacterium]
MPITETEKKHLLRLRRELAGCTVLLKTNGDFPLKKPGKLALYGNGARHTIKGGTGSGEVNSRFFITAERGLKKAGFAITTGSWLDAYDRVLEDTRRRFLDDIRARARAHRTLAIIESFGAVMSEPEYEIPLETGEDNDAAVYVLARISGEGSDRTFAKGDIALTDTEVRDILALSRSGRPFLLVLNTGGPVDLTPVVDEVPNILILSQLGAETGTALARILLGRDTPSGKLTTTWAGIKDYPSIGDFGDRNDTHYREGIYVGYRYFDTAGITPLFPFGHGLSYTTFTQQVQRVYAQGETVHAEILVRNTGSCKGREVVQLYVSVPSGRLDQPVKTLAAFAKTKELQPGEEEILCPAFRMRGLSSYDTQQAAYILEAGDYILSAGTSSADVQCCGIIRLPSEVITVKTRNLFASSPEDVRPGIRPAPSTSPSTAPQPAAAPDRGTIRKDVPLITVPAAAIRSVTVNYGRKEIIDPLAEKLSSVELAYLNIGAFSEKGGIASVVGDASISVAGAAGETARILREKGIDSLVMADGPAGLRLAKHAARRGDKVTAIGPVMQESLSELLPGPLKVLLKFLEKRPRKSDVLIHQYATAIPIGTALAQSWDESLAEACGDIVGAEMEQFGVHLWLAPALNIHRDIRCGRNFEYFSEDPLISGRMAAALTNGVQRHSGCGVTIKHFAANNQETNRYSNNSIVSERAFREIYLKGFEICIRTARPAAVMTSYNLLNGTHTSELQGLVRDVLRCELGFDGVVMTDWIVKQMYDKNAVYLPPRADLTTAADGDLFMPGSAEDHRAVLEGLAAGTVTRRHLEESASRLLRLIRTLHQDT